MPRPEYKPADYLTAKGRRIFLKIIEHIRDKELVDDIDTLELSMLANSFDVYERMAELCNSEGDDGGYTEIVTGKNGSFKQSRPEYTIMKDEYKNIMKHSMKYGLNPGDREKIFGGMKAKKKKNPNEGLDDEPMRIAK